MLIGRSIEDVTGDVHEPGQDRIGAVGVVAATVDGRRKSLLSVGATLVLLPVFLSALSC